MAFNVKDIVASSVSKQLDKANNKRKRSIDEAIDLTNSANESNAPSPPSTPTGRQHAPEDASMPFQGKTAASHAYPTPQSISTAPGTAKKRKQLHDLPADRQNVPGGASAPSPSEAAATSADPPPQSAGPAQSIAGKQKKLHDLPELSDRYIPKYSTMEGVEYKDPQQFSIKPAYWRRWEPAQYHSFATHLREWFDPAPFAYEHGVLVEEVRAVFTAVVCRPLWDAAEAKKRGEEGIQHLFHLYNTYSTPSRSWGKKGVKKVLGEFADVEDGKVVLIGKLSGNKYEMRLGDMSEADLEWLEENVTSKQRRTMGMEAAV